MTSQVYARNYLNINQRELKAIWAHRYLGSKSLGTELFGHTFSDPIVVFTWLLALVNTVPLTSVDNYNNQHNIVAIPNMGGQTVGQIKAMAARRRDPDCFSARFFVFLF